jgi:hypothetical protein
VFQLQGLDFAIPFKEEGSYYTNYIRFQQALRMKLLRIREIKPYLFTGKHTTTSIFITVFFGFEIYVFSIYRL